MRGSPCGGKRSGGGVQGSSAGSRVGAARPGEGLPAAAAPERGTLVERCPAYGSPCRLQRQRLDAVLSNPPTSRSIS